MATLLVYDVDPQFRETIKAALGALGHNVVLATDGYSVLPLAAQHKPALFILDFKLPEAAGFEILLRLRKVPEFAATPIIFASATPKFEIEMTVLDPVAVGYVDKPLNARQLKEELEALLPGKPSAPQAAAPGAAAASAAAAPAAFTGEADLDGSRDDVISLD